MSSLPHVKRLTIFLSVVLLLTAETVYFLAFPTSISATLLRLGFGLIIVVSLIEVSFHFGEQLQDQIVQETRRREAMAGELHLRSSALETAVNAIVITNRQGQIIWVNSAFTTLTGYTREEVVGKNPRLLRSGAHDEPFYRQMWETILSGQAWQGEVVNMRKDGRTYTEEQTITPVLDENGRISHFIAIKQDITKRKEAEDELKQFTERLEAIHDIDQAILARRSPEEIAQVALERLRGFVHWSRASVFLLDSENKQAVTLLLSDQSGLTLKESHHFRYEHEQVLQMARDNKIYHVPDIKDDPGSDLCSWLKSTGLQAYVSVPIMVQTDKLIGLLNLGSDVPYAFTDKQLAITREITNSLAIALQHSHLYIAERAQRERAEALQRTGIALNSTLDFKQVMDLIMDQVARVVPFDMGNMIIIEGNEAHISHSRGYEQLDPDLPAQIEKLRFNIDQTPNLRHIRETQQPLIIGDVWEYPGWLREKGAPQTRAWLGVPILINGQIVVIFALSKRQPRYFGQEHVELLQAFAAQASLALENARLYEELRAHAAMLEDRVAERTRALAEANERLTELDRLKSKFISDISHELRTPITNVNIYIDLLERGKPEKHGRYYQILRQETLRLTHLIESIFDESRQTSHLRQAEYRLVDLNQIVREVVGAHEDRIRTRQLDLELTLDPQLPPILGEHTHLTRVVTNLLVNAINYTPEGVISVQTLQNGRHISLRVADTGMGIVPEDIPHLFDRFYRGQNASQSTIPGIGLGLGVVKEIVSLHHGEVQVQPRETGGTVFEVRLPIPGR